MVELVCELPLVDPSARLSKIRSVPGPMSMLATIISDYRGKVQILQIEAPVLKDCLVAWAGRVEVEGLTADGRTRLRGDMADFDSPPVAGFGNVWRLQSDLGLGGPAEATVVVVETARP
jgi:hypothetical protein